MIKAFDLSALELTEENTVAIMDATGDNPLLINGEPLTITVYGQGSKQFVSAKYKLDNASAAYFAQMVQKKSGTGNRAEEAAKNAADFLCSCTKSINGLAIEPLALYSNHKLKYITDQVDKYLGDAANFMPSFPAK